MVVLTSFIMPESPIKCEQRNTRAILDKKDLGLGTLYISEKTVSWQEQMGRGFSLVYNHISLHAISTDTNVYPRECIYVMIDTHVQMPGDEPESVSHNSDESDAESESDYSELIFVPGDPGALQSMYESLKECQALNPDPEDVEDYDTDGVDEVYEDADEEMNDRIVHNITRDIGGGGDTDMESLVQRLQMNNVQIDYNHSNGYHLEDEQFDDAD